MALATQLKKLKEQRKKYDDAIAAFGRKKLGKELAKLIPEGFALAWTQYTPGFNDGEPCRFTLGEVYLTTIKLPENAEKVESSDDEDEDEDIEVAAEPTADGEVATMDDVAEAEEAEDDTDEVDDEEPDPEDREYFDPNDLDGDEATVSLEYGDASDLKQYGLKKKDFSTLKAAWKLIPKDLLEKAFGDSALVIIKSGGSVTVEDYDCGY